MPGVTTKHPLYSNLEDKWERCRDCVAGEDAIKSKKTKYLPMLASHREKNEKYNDYLMRTLFYNAMGRTVAGLAGAIFQKTPSTDVENTELRDHLKDVTLTDETIEIFALNVTKEILTTGRYGILVDMSTELATKPRPYWVGYAAEDIVNWRFRNLGGDKELCFVVLREVIQNPSPDDEFDTEPVTQYRVLRLSDAGIYTQQVYTAVNSGPSASMPGMKSTKIEYVGGEIVTPTRRNRHLDFIPFSLPWEVANPPLVDLVSVNLSHYRGTADLKHGLHFTALPTPWVSGHQDSNKALSIGSGTAWSLEKDGRAGMLEFTGRGLGAIRTDLQDMQRMMATLGARLLEEAPRYAETALSVSMRHGSDYATLRMIAHVVERQITYALKIHDWWLGTKPLVAEMKANLELNKVFFDHSVTADELRALLLALQGGTISYKTFYDRLSNTGWTREGIDSEEELEDIKKDGDKFKEEEKPGKELPLPKSTMPGSEPPPKPVS